LLTATSESTLEFDQFTAVICMALYMGLNYESPVLEVFFAGLQILNSLTQHVKRFFKQRYRFFGRR